MNGTAAADPTLETHNTHYRVPTKAGSTLFYSKLHAVEESNTEKIDRYPLFYYLLDFFHFLYWT